MQERFTSQEVIALIGITPRQLQWWDERGVVKPEREGHRRLYSMNHLTEVAVICELRRKGFSLQGVRKVMRFLDREVGKGLAASGARLTFRFARRHAAPFYTQAATDSGGGAEIKLEVDEAALPDSSVLVQANYEGRTATRKFLLRKAE